MQRVALRVASALALAFAAACTRDAPKAPPPPGNPDPLTNTYAESLHVQLPAFFKTPSGIYYQDVVPGTGPVVVAGNTASVHYTGWLPNGSKFDASRDHPPAAPFEFQVGGGNVIRGWDEGVQGMKVGGTRLLVIPAALGYGEQGAPPDIPANSTLVFRVELLAIK